MPSPSTDPTGLPVINQHVRREQLRSGEITGMHCGKCEELKQIDMFGSWLDARTGLQMWHTTCRACIRTANRMRRQALQTAPPKSVYCDAKCGRKLVHHGKDKYSANLDHDPETGEFRGWICSSCNKGLGFFGDNLAGLERAVIYLKEHTSSPHATTHFTD